ncbi:MAG: 2-C-methyl-D-erythritol 4-phosphate cytidylyltransferase [Fibromonadaceae bacterium]|jgi:2-C-methyl-D-erythritol 4-phosphate cytidylyltransferase|nr:2-C-methyl-D-erythritol 4-phosphate cytidylyltransferase [Fibromonadaceae bacterium]
MIGAVITAGGLGRRVGGEVPKQLVELRGKAMWKHSAETFLKHKNIKAVVLTVPENWQSFFIEEARDLSLIVAIGGKERWQSVKNGIEALPPGISHVMVHDAARPFVSEGLISEMASVLEHSCCMVAKPVFDTVKIAESGFVKNTLDRSTVWLAQTPQAAPVALLKELYEKMQGIADFCPTDEASILEKFGVPIKIVEGNEQNNKITTKEELEFSTFLLNNIRS